MFCPRHKPFRCRHDRARDHRTTVCAIRIAVDNAPNSAQRPHRHLIEKHEPIPAFSGELARNNPSDLRAGCERIDVPTPLPSTAPAPRPDGRKCNQDFSPTTNLVSNFDADIWELIATSVFVGTHPRNCWTPAKATLPTVPRGFKLWKPIFVWRLALRGADSILAPGRLYRCLPEHRRLCSLRTPSHSLLVQVDRPKVTNQQPDSSRPS